MTHVMIATGTGAPPPLLDLTEEEAALCSFICPSKIDFDLLLREGLDLYVQEA